MKLYDYVEAIRDSGMSIDIHSVDDEVVLFSYADLGFKLYKYEDNILLDLADHTPVCMLVSAEHLLNSILHQATDVHYKYLKMCNEDALALGYRLFHKR